MLNINNLQITSNNNDNIMIKNDISVLTIDVVVGLLR